MIWFAYFMKSLNHLIYVDIKKILFFRKRMIFDHLLHINFVLSFIFCLQSIKKNRLIKIWKIRIWIIFNDLRLRKRFVLFCQKNRFIFQKKHYCETFSKKFIAYTLCWMQCTHQLLHVRKYRCVNRCCVDFINMTKLFVLLYNRFDVAKIQRSY